MVSCKASNLTQALLALNFSAKSSPKIVAYNLQRNSSCLRNKSCIVFSSSTISSGWNSEDNHEDHFVNGVNNCSERQQREEKGEEERTVNCEVEVISWRERRVQAQILVNADVGSVWNALTDYERLSHFIPNLVSSGRIPCPHPGRIWLEQRGLQRALYWHIEARVVLDLQEVLNSANDRKLQFSMVDGDFKKFEGKWSVKSGKRPETTILSYEVNVIPRLNFPAIFLERIIRSDLPVNLQALACRAERTFGENQNAPVTDTVLVTTSMARSPGIRIDDAISEKDKLSPGDLEDGYATSSFVRVSQSSSELSSNWGVFGKVCNLDRPCIVDEVHLRRFDGLLENGGVHRGVVASITIKASVQEVWNTLTAYERLPEAGIQGQAAANQSKIPMWHPQGGNGTIAPEAEQQDDPGA